MVDSCDKYSTDCISYKKVGLDADRAVDKGEVLMLIVGQIFSVLYTNI